MDEFWKTITTLFLIFLAVAVLLHATGASTVLGTMFTGLTGLGTTIESAGTSSQNYPTGSPKG